MRCVPFVLIVIVPIAFVGNSATTADTANPVVIKKAEKHIDLLVGNELVGRYHIDPTLAKPHFHPLNGPHGQPVTRLWPMSNENPDEAKDHVHQKAAWFCHGDVIPEGISLKQKVKGVEGVDFWAESPGHGWMVCTSVGEAKSEKDHAWISTHNEWQTADREKIMDEDRVIHLYDLGKAKLLVFDIDLHASVCPITFGDTKEGSMGVRVAETMTENKKLGGVLENADGKRTMKECWGVASKWCDYSGPVGGWSVGLAIFDHPNNPYPAYWHSRNYGLMAANPFGRNKSGYPGVKGRTDLVKLSKGDHLKLRYGLLIHAGNAAEGEVAKHYSTFTDLK